ncbi:flagellar biosynthesis protein FlhB [Algiphilus sp.]|uniref:flagellar biosynthesis protein FlhB n=1 Tax=Algiphilus sp. TaxID=1872431 RepID=UPI0025C05356|nr:flagellar biosynthesis protein FlhB [Algiphilus sp.]MCK5771054.1 flagellar biosynthesis protein FlhB [Algiphilus sp.]
MAENESGQEKTESATPRRLEQAREEGQLARSRELPGALIAVAGALGAWVAGGELIRHFAGWFAHAIRQAGTRHDDVMVAAGDLAVHGAGVLLPWLFLVAVAGIGGTLALGGWNLTGKALAPKGERLDPFKGMKRIFGANAWVELSKTLLKFALVSGLGFAVIWWLREDIARLPRMDAQAGFGHAGIILLAVFSAGALALLLISAVDAPWQLFNHARQMRMTREEVKREAKDTDGKPEVKARQRQLQAEAARGRMMEAVPEADVVIVNPIHVAVALRYDAARMDAPQVVAKGLGEVAASIRGLAEAHRVPVLEAPPLARALYRATALGETVPAGLFAAVAEVLTWVYRLRVATAGAAPERPNPHVDDALGAPIE